MPIVTLHDLYTAELQDLADVERQMLAALPAMVAAATSSRLRDALQEHLEQTQVHAERLGLLLRKVGAPGDGVSCDAMRGIVAEGRRRIAEAERGDVLDAALIGIAQRIEHYEIAAYGCARTYARTLEDGEAEQLLQQTLDEEGDADARLSRIAERGVNPPAAEGLSAAAAGDRRRLRYVPASTLREFKYREFRIRNGQGEDLGSFDGVIVEAASGRPLYTVIDSGGWFMGQRFLVPVDALRPDEAANTLRTDLDRETVHSYPPFTPDAYERDDTSRDWQPPQWLLTGVWMTESSGFASVPPRATSDLRPGQDERRNAAETYAETERITARGEDERTRRHDDAPRIERYGER